MTDDIPVNRAHWASRVPNCGASIDYVESELYDAVDTLGACQFDLVYTESGHCVHRLELASADHSKWAKTR